MISLLVSLHVMAVFVGPWAMPPHGSELARTIAGVHGPYLQAAFLNNGYRFFAPEPGPGHLVRYEVVTRDGRKIEGSFPDKKAQWPRLLYHRYFMLSEFLNSLSAPEAAEMATAYAEVVCRASGPAVRRQKREALFAAARLPTMAEVRARQEAERSGVLRRTPGRRTGRGVRHGRTDDDPIRSWFNETAAGWDRFWFTPADPATLALIRILAGAMLFYTHLVWGLALTDFFGEHGWLEPKAVQLVLQRFVHLELSVVVPDAADADRSSTRWRWSSSRC